MLFRFGFGFFRHFHLARGHSSLLERIQSRQSPTGHRRRVAATVAPRLNAGSARWAASASGSGGYPRLHRQQSLTLELFASQLSGAADRFRLLSDPPLGGLLVLLPKLHLTEDALALHLPLQYFESLIDIVVTDENLH